MQLYKLYIVYYCKINENKISILKHFHFSTKGR